VATVVAPGPVFQVLSTSRLDGRTLASMAISSGSIFIRTDSHLYRIGAEAPPGSLVRLKPDTTLPGPPGTR
jgi:hypothetical protein